MTEGFITGPSVPPSPRSATRRAMLVTLAGVLAIIGALVAAYYFAVKPVTLKVAVGPVNSDDVKVVQMLTQAFGQEPCGDGKILVMRFRQALTILARFLQRRRCSRNAIRFRQRVPPQRHGRSACAHY